MNSLPGLVGLDIAVGVRRIIYCIRALSSRAAKGVSPARPWHYWANFALITLSSRPATFSPASRFGGIQASARNDTLHQSSEGSDHWKKWCLRGLKTRRYRCISHSPNRHLITPQVNSRTSSKNLRPANASLATGLDLASGLIIRRGGFAPFSNVVIIRSEQSVILTRISIHKPIPRMLKHWGGIASVQSLISILYCRAEKAQLRVNFRR